MNYLDYIEAPMCVSTGPITMTAGSSAIANGAVIESKYRGPLLINEIEFVLSMQGVTELLAADPRSVIRVSILAGRMALTNEYVPMGLLGVANGLVKPNAVGTDFGIEDLAADLGTYDGLRPNYASTYWRFPKPLFYPPSLGFNIRYQRFVNNSWGTVATRNITIDAVVRGYYLQQDMPYPTEIDVPWAAGGSFRIPGDAASTIRTPDEATFRNPFHVPLHLQRFTARYYTQGYLSGLNENTPWVREAGFGVQATTGTSDEVSGALLKIMKQDGTVIVPNAIPLWQAIDWRRQLWNVNSDLMPNENLDVRMLNFRAPDPVVVASNTFKGYPQVGMIGYRKEVLA